jgi:hypothetical protein
MIQVSVLEYTLKNAILHIEMVSCEFRFDRNEFVVDEEAARRLTSKISKSWNRNRNRHWHWQRLNSTESNDEKFYLLINDSGFNSKNQKLVRNPWCSIIHGFKWFKPSWFIDCYHSTAKFPFNYLHSIFVFFNFQTMYEWKEKRRKVREGDIISRPK